MISTVFSGRNFDEALVPPYQLPPLLVTAQGEPVSDVQRWERVRRGELLDFFRTHIYGTPPPVLPFQVRRHEEGTAFGSLAVREQLSLCFGAGRTIDLLIYRPAAATGPVPVFLGLNYYGNHSTTRDPMVRAETSSRFKVARGEAASRWPYEALLKRGFAVATFCYEDVADDHVAHWRERFPSLADASTSGNPGNTEPGAIAWWAWGMSRAMDYLQEQPHLYRADRVMLVGQSRHGKAALWAGAEDARFAAVFSNCSGCTGAALAKRKFGETVAIINDARPHWLCGNYKRFNHREEALPVDQHQLLALIAPRLLYIASATEDFSADPLGEYLAAFHAQPAYALYGCRAVLPERPPGPDRSVGAPVGYHIRTGKHDITAADWRHFARFAETVFSAPETYNFFH
ncbi:MAG TPA: acetylxylan esterase [Chthoniobacteraceae bacterium]|nr:acetylxylan esterase [Chthoniobacteraceae bacterium]